MDQQTHILHVDDDPGIVEVTKTVLERENPAFQVNTATSGAEGLETVRTEDIDCVVSDYEMPGQDGIEFLQAVRAEYADLPFILFTGRGSEAIASEAISAGVTDYLQKGTGTDQYAVLANRVANAVEQYRSKHRLREREQELEQKNDELATTRTRLERALQTTETYTFDWDLRADEIERHPTFESLFGHPSAAAKPVFDSFFDLVVPGHRERVEQEIAVAIEAGESYDLRYPMQTADDEVRWVRERAEVIVEDGEPRRALGTVTDITEHRNCERELEQLHGRLGELAHQLTRARQACASRDLDNAESVLEEAHTVVTTLTDGD